jgi:hypothetical protein
LFQNRPSKTAYRSILGGKIRVIVYFYLKNSKLWQ